MLTITTVGSGSSGNCYVIDIDGEKLLIECGIHAREMLKAVNFDVRSIAGCVVSHSHKDHIQYVRDYQKYGFPIYMSEQSKPDDSSVFPMKRMRFTHIGRFDVLPFQVPHNGTECDGFYIRHKDCGELVYITDAELLPFDLSKLSVKHLMIECNYKAEYIDHESENASHVYLGHMELETCKKAIKNMYDSGLKSIGLIHLSHSNADENEFKNDVSECFPDAYVWVADKQKTVRLEA